MPDERPRGDRIAILGAGREGIAVFDHLRRSGFGDNITVLAETSTGSINESRLNELGVLKVCSLDEADLASYDLLVRSPGISCYRPCLREAREAGVQMTTPSSIWFAGHPDARTIVITGTKGKSTTAALLAYLLERAGLRTRLAGNIGTPLLACDDREVDWWVIELSSYQLADLEATPTLGVLLNLATDHLDWHGTEARYHSDKLRLADLVKTGRLLANDSDTNLRAALRNHDSVKWFDVKTGGAAGIEMPSSLPGAHNRVNLAACLAVFRELGLEAGQALKGLSGFTGLPHRLKSIGSFDGVEFVDDSISTAPVATIAALEAFRERQVVLLIGGFERGIDWTPYMESFMHHPPLAVIALPDNGPRILGTLEKSGFQPELGLVCAENLNEAVKISKKLAPTGGLVLLSPGAPSFPHFRDYEDRGRKFAELCAGMAGSE